MAKRRIKLRFRPQDIDLIAIKQYSPELFSSIFNVALLEYITYGKCNRFQIPETEQPVKVVDEMIMITIHHDIIDDWINSIPAGLRSETVKTVLRSAIENPAVNHCVGFNMDLIREQKNNSKKSDTRVLGSDGLISNQWSSKNDAVEINNEEPLDDDLFWMSDDAIGNI